MRHHEPAARGGPPGRDGGRRDDGQRPRLRGVDRRYATRGPHEADRRTPARRPRGRHRAAEAPSAVTSRGRRGARRLHALGQAGPVPGRAPRCWTRRARSASTSTRCAAGAGSAAAARWCRWRGRVRQARHQVGRRPSDRRSPSPRPATATARPARRAAARLPRARHRRPRRRRAAGEPGPPPGRAQGGRRPRRSRSTRSCGCTTSRSASPTWPTRAATCSGCSRRLEREWQLDRSRLDPHVLPVLQPALRDGGVDGDRRRARRRDDHAICARLPRRRARRRVRRGLDDGGRTPVRSPHGRGAGVAPAR